MTKAKQTKLLPALLWGIANFELESLLEYSETLKVVMTKPDQP